MNKTIKMAIKRGIIPLVVMTLISFMMQRQGMDETQVKSTFLAGLIITSVVATSVIYDIDSWSFTKQSIVHFFMMLLTVFPCLVLSGWFTLNNFSDYLKLFGIFVFVGLILWSISYIIFGKLLNRK